MYRKTFIGKCVLVSFLFIFFASGVFTIADAAVPVLTNGSLTGTPVADEVPAGWTIPNPPTATPSTVNENGPFNFTDVPWTLSPDGGTFVRGNGHVDVEFQDAFEQSVSGFTIGASYTLDFYQTNLGFRDQGHNWDDWLERDGYWGLFVDGALVGQSTTIGGPATFDTPIVWSSDSISFTASGTTQTIRLQAFTAEAEIAYLGIDGLRFFSEICDNGIDDDGDGLVDSDDPDCDPPPPPPPTRVGLNVRCLHEPIYPQLGDEVTITAEAIDNNGNAVVPDVAEIYRRGDLNEPVKTVINQNAFVTFVATSGSFSYGCRVEKDTDEAKSWNHFDEKLRSVDVGVPNNPDWKAIPVIYNGPVSEKIDIIFFPDDTEYLSFSDPKFLIDVHDLLDEGYFTIPWFVQFQWLFNFWIAMDNTADASPKTILPPDPTTPGTQLCRNIAPDNFEKNYAWAEAAGIVHTSVCRDNASSSVFTIEMQASRLQVVAHEIGHAAFGFADEYCCDGGYFSSKFRKTKEEYDPPFPNLFETEVDCQADAFNRPYSAFDCRPIATEGDFVWWIGEPDYGAGIPQVDEIRDLMQQTGGEKLSPTLTVDRYEVGDSERDRLIWMLGNCTLGDC